MDYDFFHLLILGSIRDPILWILSFVIASSIITNSYKRKLLYLSAAGVIWGYIRLYIYKSFGQIFTFEQTLTLLIVCLLLMVCFGSALFLLFKLLKSNS